jgi:hypothetical protein
MVEEPGRSEMLADFARRLEQGARIVRESRRDKFDPEYVSVRSADIAKEMGANSCNAWAVRELVKHLNANKKLKVKVEDDDPRHALIYVGLV